MSMTLYFCLNFPGVVNGKNDHNPSVNPVTILSAMWLCSFSYQETEDSIPSLESGLSNLIGPKQCSGSDGVLVPSLGLKICMLLVTAKYICIFILQIGIWIFFKCFLPPFCVKPLGIVICFLFIIWLLLILETQKENYDHFIVEFWFII